MAEAVKQCRSCGEAKSRSEFHRKASATDGLSPRCKACRLAVEADRRRRAGIPERERFDDPPGSKTCRRCRVRMPASSFRAAPRNADRLQSYCNACQRVLDRPRREAEKAARRAAREAARPPEGYKLCCRCVQTLPVSAFTRNRRKRDGLEPWCRDCERARKGSQPKYVDPAPDGHKTCGTCRRILPLDAFYADPRLVEKGWAQGVAGSCKACRLEKDDRRRRAAGIPARPRFDDGPGEKTCRRCRLTKPLAEFGPEPRNRDGLRSWCYDCVAERTIEWHRANPAAILRLKALRRSAEDIGAVSERDWVRLLVRWNWSCAYCGAPSRRLHADHVVPVTRGGRHAIGNLLPVCRQCNSSKSNRLLSEWRYRTRRRRIPTEVFAVFPARSATRENGSADSDAPAPQEAASEHFS